jgi:glycosyltransferase involved in cell wall biosynthesis
VRVAVVAEFYPRAHDPVLGVWAHRQALAARDAGAEVRVLVLHRPVPPRATRPRELPRAAATLARQPRHATLDGLEVEYVPFLAPPRPRTYGSWGAWAAAPLALALRSLRRRFAFELVHAHNAVPAGDAVRRARLSVPLVVSVHGGDVFHTAPKMRAGRRNVAATFARARLVLANSGGIEQKARALGAARTRVVHLGADLPPAWSAAAPGEPVLVSVAHLVARKRHEDVLHALALLPGMRYLVIGDGPERARLEALARTLGLDGRVTFTGQLEHAEALRRARAGSLFVLPSTDEAFGVAYVEAMAGGVPAIGLRGEPGPQEIAAAGAGMLLAPPRDPRGLAAAIEHALADPGLRGQARATVERAFTWERCGAETLAAYEEALRA